MIPRAGSEATSVPGRGRATALDEPPRRAFLEMIMGIPISVHVRGPMARRTIVAEAVGELFAALRADDALFSTWTPTSQVSQIRRGELRLGDAEPRVRLVAELCEEAAARTGGLFCAWLPAAEGKPVFDPTGLVKGWAAEQAFDTFLDRLGVLGRHDALLSAGGDVVVACSRTDTLDWQIAIEDPRDRCRTLLSVPLRRGAVATSGTAARGAHIVNPRTGARVRGLLSATVIGPSLTWADVYATAVFVDGPESTAAWIAERPDHAVVRVTSDGEIRTGP